MEFPSPPPSLVQSFFSCATSRTCLLRAASSATSPRTGPASLCPPSRRASPRSDSALRRGRKAWTSARVQAALLFGRVPGRPRGVTTRAVSGVLGSRVFPRQRLAMTLFCGLFKRGSDHAGGSEDLGEGGRVWWRSPHTSTGRPPTKLPGEASCPALSVPRREGGRSEEGEGEEEERWGGEGRRGVLGVLAPRCGWLGGSKWTHCGARLPRTLVCALPRKPWTRALATGATKPQGFSCRHEFQRTHPSRGILQASPRANGAQSAMDALRDYLPADVRRSLATTPETPT